MYFRKIKKQDENYKKIEIKYDELSATHYSFKLFRRHPFIKNYIPKDKFINIIDKANIIIYDAKLKKAKFDKVEINKFAYLLLLSALILIIIYIFLFYYSPRIEKNRTKLKNCGLIFFCITVFLLFLLEILNSIRKIEGDKTLFDFYKDDMNNYIDQLNEIYKDKIIFNFDENNKNITCYIKIDNNSFDNNNCSSEISNDNDISSSQGAQKTYSNYISSRSDLYNSKENE